MKKMRYFIFSLIAFLALSLVPVFGNSEEYVRDDYGVLGDTGFENTAVLQLNDRAASLSQAHEVGIYIRVFPDMRDYGYNNVEEFAEYVYQTEDLGYGTEKNGVMLLLSMGDRSYDILAYGNKANEAFTDHAKDVMEEAFLPYLRNNDYYSAFNEFMSQCDQMLVYDEAGTPFDIDTDPVYLAEMERKKEAAEQASRTAKTGATVGVPIITALLTCLGMKGKNKTTGIKHDASNYMVKNSIVMRNSQDIFTHSTQTVTHIHHDDHSSGGGGGGTSINSGGFSHSSGHF